MGTHGTIRTELRGARLDVALDRPDVRNAFDDRLVLELTEVLSAAAEDEELRCLVLSGRGRTFCAGADLNWMRAAAGYGPEENEADARRMARLFKVLDELPFPTVARVHGAALGGATGLVAACDVALAAEGTRFGFTEVRLGIIPAVISPFVLRKIPRHAALRYFQTGEIFPAERAREIGLVSEVVPEAALDDRVRGVVEHVLAAGPRAVREARRLIDAVSGTPLPQAVGLTARWIADVRATEEAREGMSAFLEKRPPRWKEESP